MKIKRFIGGVLESNGYVIYDEKSRNGYIIDPGYNHKVFLDFLMMEKITLKAILLTHHHHDHVGAVKKIVAETDVPVYIHPLDMDMVKFSAEPMDESSDFSIGNDKITVVHTPGHTEGGVCLVVESKDIAFTGDTIFNVDLGRTDLEDGSEKKMIESIKNIIDKWGNGRIIYPGHGNSSTMKMVRVCNREFLDIVKGK